MMHELSIERLIRQHIQDDTWIWLEGSAVLVREEQGAAELKKTFAFIPRRTGGGLIGAALIGGPGTETAECGKEWTIDRLCRVWLLMQLNSTGKGAYLKKIEDLFSGASMNEEVALYSALPVLAYPMEWQKRCAMGIRSNIGTVLEAIMYQNDYPYHYLDEPAWNQMVLKAFFTDKDITRIFGIDQRANLTLASVLFDYAHERWAAGRTVNPQLWRLTAAFVDERNFQDVERLFNQGNAVEKKAALLVCWHTGYMPAKHLLDSEPEFKRVIADGKLQWNNLI